MIEVENCKQLGGALKTEARGKIAQPDLAKESELTLYKIKQIFKGNDRVSIGDYSKVAIALGLKIKFVIRGK